MGMMKSDLSGVRNMKTLANKSKRALALVLAVLLLLSLAGCGYASHYSAVGFVHSNEARSAYMSFWSFEGRMVFKLKSSGEGDLTYSVKLEEGNAKVYYDSRGTKAELCSVSGGDAAASHGGYVEAGTVYVIVETDGTCLNGDFRFSLD